MIKATEEGQIALGVAYSPGSTQTQSSDTKLVIKGGEYSSDKYSGMVIGDKGSVVICDGDVIGGTNQEDSAFSGVVVRAGGKLNMAGGSIKGGDGSESGSRGVSLSVVGDGDDATSTTSTTSTATIVGGNIAAGTEPGLSLYVGNATVNVWGGTLGSQWLVADGGTVKVYGKDLTLVGDDLKGRLCDGSPINVNLIEGGNVELMQAPCKDAPKFDECGKQAKSKGRKGSKSNEMFER